MGRDVHSYLKKNEKDELFWYSKKKIILYLKFLDLNFIINLKYVAKIGK